ncbi:MAG: sodium:solute symporter family transporter [Opitutales bacterium]
MHIVDILIIVAFLIATLYIGFSSGKKIKTFSDYAIGNRNFSDFAMYCTVAATCIGGTTTMGNVGKVYNIGIAQFIAQIGFSLSFAIVAIFLARRFSNYYECYSLGDMFYKSYGLTGKTLAGIAGFIYELLAVGVQFMAMGTAISVLTGFSYQTSLLISAGIVLIYTGRGGVRAVTFTDVLQFMVLILAIPILLIVVLKKIGGIHELVLQLPQSHLTISDENLRRYLFLILPVMLPSLAPHHAQRLLMTKNRAQGVKAYYYLTCSFLFVVILSLFLGLAAKVLLPSLQRSDQALFALITNCLPVGIFGIAIVGILAVLMSSADSVLNSGSIVLVNDLILPFVKRDLSENTKLKLVRITSIFIGICALIFASQCTSIFETRIIISTFWQAVILSPLYFLLFNMKIPLKGLFMSATIGLTTCILWNINIKPSTKIDGLFPGFFANVITVLFFYFLGGRQKVFSKEELEKMRRAEAVQTKKRPSVRDLQMRNNTILGLCLVFLQFMPLMFNTNSLTYSKLMLTLVNGTMAILLIFGGSLELFAKEKRFQWLKLTTLFFCLPITSAYLFLSSAENGLHALTLLVSFIVMLSSAEKKHEAPIGIACFLTAFLTLILYFYNNCQLCWPETFAWQHSFYVVGYVTVLFLLRSNLNTLQQIKEIEKEQEKYRERYMMARSLSHDLMSPLMALHLLSSQKKLNEFDEKECQLHQNIISEMENYINDFIVGGLKEQSQLKLEDLNQCVLSCIEKQTILQPNFNIQLQAKETFFARVDAVLLRRIINNLVNVCRHALPNGCNTIVIAIDNDPLGNTQILLQAANGGFSQKALNSMFIEDQKLGDEVELGISFPEFQDIVAKWKGKLELISQEDNAIIQLLIPNKDNNKLIQKA